MGYDDKLYVWILASIAVINVLLVGTGLTGMAITSVQEPCTLDADCTLPEQCCMFYGENHGICGERQLCDTIADRKLNEYDSKNSALRYAQVGAGGLLLLTLLYGVVAYRNKQ